MEFHVLDGSMPFRERFIPVEGDGFRGFVQGARFQTFVDFVGAVLRGESVARERVRALSAGKRADYIEMPVSPHALEAPA